MKITGIENRINVITDKMSDIVKSGRIEAYNKDLKLLLEEYKILKSYTDLLRKNKNEDYSRFLNESKFLLPKIPEEDVYGFAKFKQRPQDRRLLSPEEFAQIKELILESL